MGSHQFREDGSHYNGGAVFFGYGYAAIGEPRLRMIRKWFRQGERRGLIEDSFHVDGVPVESYAAALEALKTPPSLDATEMAALAAFGDEPIRRPRDHELEVCLALRAEGFVSARDGFWTIAEPGRAALRSAAALAREAGE